MTPLPLRTLVFSAAAAGVCVTLAHVLIAGAVRDTGRLGSPDTQVVPGVTLAPGDAPVLGLYGAVLGGGLGGLLHALVRRTRRSAATGVTAPAAGAVDPKPAARPAPPPQPPSSPGSQMTEAELDVARANWAEQARTRAAPLDPTTLTAWTDSPIVQQHYLFPLVSQRNDEPWLTTVGKRFFPTPAERALSVGCGNGPLERHALMQQYARFFDACDLSPGAIEVARQAAVEMGIADRVVYHVVDINVTPVPKDSYDAVFFGSSLHHVQNLEWVLDNVGRGLRPGGLLVVNEYIGPNQFQWTDAQIRHSQRLLDALPERYRRVIPHGHLKTVIGRNSIETMNAVDPTEAIRSEDIVPEIEKRFDVIWRVDLGGTLLQLVLQDIAGNFRIENEEDVRWMKMLFDEEQRLLRTGEIQTMHMLLVAKPKAHAR